MKMVLKAENTRGDTLEGSGDKSRDLEGASLRAASIPLFVGNEHKFNCNSSFKLITANKGRRIVATVELMIKRLATHTFHTSEEQL